MEIFGILFFLVFLALAMGALGLWIWMLVDCAVNEPSEGNDKLVWILVIIFTSWLGALIYLLVRRPRRIRKYGR
jgi:hypothetical protein